MRTARQSVTSGVGAQQDGGQGNGRSGWVKGGRSSATGKVEGRKGSAGRGGLTVGGQGHAAMCHTMEKQSGKGTGMQAGGGVRRLKRTWGEAAGRAAVAGPAPTGAVGAVLCCGKEATAATPPAKFSSSSGGSAGEQQQRRRFSSSTRSRRGTGLCLLPSCPAPAPPRCKWQSRPRCACNKNEGKGRRERVRGRAASTEQTLLGHGTKLQSPVMCGCIEAGGERRGQRVRTSR